MVKNSLDYLLTAFMSREISSLNINNKSMNIEGYKKLFAGKSKEFIQPRLDEVLEEIKFLESIYMGDGVNSWCSEEIKAIAYKERQEKCQLSSALYSLLKGY